MTHEELIIFMDSQVQLMLSADRNLSEDGELTAKGEALGNAFMFFVTSVSKK